MRRSILLSIFVLNIIVESSGCTFADQSVKQNTNETSQANTNVRKEGDPVERPRGNLFESEMKDYNDEIAKKLGLTQLKNTKNNQFELRLWINSGMPSDEKLLILRSSESDNNASFYHLQITTRDPMVFSKEVLASPKSEWNILLSEISNRLANPKGLVLDPQFYISRHEGLISLEVVEKGEYQFVLYGHHTSFGDGIRLINLCEYLSGEFGLNIDCRGQRTTLGPIQ